MEKQILLLPGDGIGPEIIAETKRVLEEIARMYRHTFRFIEGRIGGDAIDATGSPFLRRRWVLPKVATQFCLAQSADQSGTAMPLKNGQKKGCCKYAKHWAFTPTFALSVYWNR